MLHITAPHTRMPQLTLTQMGVAENKDKCFMDFVLDYDTMKATFCNLQPTKAHRQEARVRNRDPVEHAGMDQWRIWSVGDRGPRWEPEVVNRELKISVPILKSNLQKAIRQTNVEETLRTTTELALMDRLSLLRRLPIIAIEDVSLIVGTSTIVWFMMVDRGYLYTKELAFILKYVSALCQTTRTFRNDRSIAATHIGFRAAITESGESQKHEVAALQARIGYGGMAGDMDMLRRAVAAFRTGVIEEPMSGTEDVDVPRAVDLDHTVLLSGIDFHPCPWILKYIHRQTQLPENVIKSQIWYAESAPNNRKPWTLAKSARARSDDTWTRIKPCLDAARIMILEKRE